MIIYLHMLVAFLRVLSTLVEMMWALRQGLPLARLQTWKSRTVTTPGNFYILSWNSCQSSPGGAASIRTLRQSPVIGIVVHITITANIRVQIGSKYFILASHQITIEAMTTPIDYTISPITWIIAAYML